mmetsp:Transcript_6253/g.17049  ORF Transcript_6253/g.17049 Transcript_6253/m.17049 type:complete len:207 (+) Transcript_6253:325-945(+)
MGRRCQRGLLQALNPLLRHELLAELLEDEDGRQAGGQELVDVRPHLHRHLRALVREDLLRHPVDGLLPRLAGAGHLLPQGLAIGLSLRALQHQQGAQHVPVRGLCDAVGKLWSQLHVLLLRHLLQHGPDVLRGGGGHPHGQASAPQRRDDLRDAVAGEDDSACLHEFLHRPPQCRLRIYREAACILDNHHLECVPADWRVLGNLLD